MAIEGAPRLGCGRSIDRIWATIDHPLTTHEEQCEQCQAARARLRALQEATTLLREKDLHDPELKPRRAITHAIMNVARAEIRRSRRIIVHSNADGTIEVSEQALASVIRYAATAIPGIHARRCHIEIHSANRPEPGGMLPPRNMGASSLISPHLVVSLRVAAADTDIPGTVDALRHRLSTAIPACVGISAGTINITVEDLYDA